MLRPAVPARSRRREDFQIGAHSRSETRVERLADQRMADRYFGEERNRVLERTEIALAEIVSRIDAQAAGARALCRTHARFKLTAVVARRVGFRIGLRIDLDAIRTDRDCALDVRHIDVDEQADPAAERLQFAHERLQALGVATQTEGAS